MEGIKQPDLPTDLPKVVPIPDIGVATLTKAQKEHECELCFCAIAPGEYYYYAPPEYRIHTSCPLDFA